MFHFLLGGSEKSATFDCEEKREAATALFRFSSKRHLSQLKQQATEGLHAKTLSQLPHDADTRAG
jgi:hypothetical protein